MHEGGHGILDGLKKKGKHSHHHHEHSHDHHHDHDHTHDHQTNLLTKLIAGLITVGAVVAFILWRIL